MNEIEGGTLTSVSGIRVGHYTDATARTGCTVVDLPEPNVITGEIRGAAPGSRETALLEPGMAVEQAQAIVLSGGSAFGLATADGVMSELAAAGRGHPTPAGVVPIVPTAVVYDLLVGDGSVRPGAAEGAAAHRSCTADPVVMGSVGAGTGATVGKWRAEFIACGVGSAAIEIDGAVIGALVVPNAMGDIFSLEGDSLTGGPHIPGPLQLEAPLGQNTTLVVVATDAKVGRADLARLAVRGQDALAACVRPAHTRFDGDTCFAVSCGDVAVSLETIAEGAFVAVGRALEAAVAATASP